MDRGDIKFVLREIRYCRVYGVDVWLYVAGSNLKDALA